MGREYKVRFDNPNTPSIDTFLRSLPCFAGFDESWKSYTYYEEDNMNDMPAAEISIEDEGIYLCDYGMSEHLFGLIVERLIAQFNRVHIEDYEV